MATCITPAVTLNELLQHHGLSEDDLNQEVASDKIHEISSLLTDDWRLLAPNMNLTDAEVKVIERDNQLEEELRKIGFLKKWKKKQSIRATYRVLVDVLMSNNNSNDASKVCELVQGK